jgi:hypothetical protein
MIYNINSKEWDYIQYTTLAEKREDNKEMVEIMMEEIEEKFNKLNGKRRG